MLPYKPLDFGHMVRNASDVKGKTSTSFKKGEEDLLRTGLKKRFGKRKTG